ncbi:MAG: poly-gamma-glutamate synthase PgsB, partial [Christensenellaceae bacterium]|nr:poly-gamma-glutamate synthase PgsB [Christensenellaceae bacterium]
EILREASIMINAMTIILIVLSVLYIAYVIAEYYYNAAKRRKILKVIHVNGIRGKSTVTRLIDAGIREFGYSVVSKTTGTVPTVIGRDNVPRPIKRLGPANVREQLKIVRKAAAQNADYLVVECMAVDPELQYLCEKQILHADVNVITNVRADHLDKMGEDLESIAYSLANTTPRDGVLVLGEDAFRDVFQRCADKQNCRLVVADKYDGEENLDTFPENIATALKVAEVLGFDRDTFFRGMKKYIHDPGALAAYKIGNTVFINGFSINDPDSTLEVYDTVIGKRYPGDKLTVLLNTRPDRPFRIDQHVDMLTKMRFKNVIIIGSNRNYVKKQLEKRGIHAQTIKKYSELLDEEFVFGCGNIASDGMKIVEYFKENGEEL